MNEVAPAPSASATHTQQQRFQQSPAGFVRSHPAFHCFQYRLPFGKGLVCTRCFQSKRSGLPRRYGFGLPQHSRHQRHHSAEPTTSGSRESAPPATRLYFAGAFARIAAGLPQRHLLAHWW